MNDPLSLDAYIERFGLLKIRPTRIFVAPAMMHLAREVLLRADALSAPLHRLRYRWSLRRRAPAWRRRRLRERDTLRAFDRQHVVGNLFLARARHEPWTCPDCGATNPGATKACDWCGGLPIRQSPEAA